MNRIPMEECEDRRLYRIHSHNLLFGVYNAKAKGFYGIREKGVVVYVFQEYHRDLDVGHATVSPIEALDEYLPQNIPLKNSLSVASYKALEDGTQEVVLEDGQVFNVPGSWDLNRPLLLENMLLKNWLLERENKYK